MGRVYHRPGDGNMAAHTPARISRALMGLVVLWGIIVLSGAGSWAQDSEHTRATLRGVQGLAVLVEDLRPGIEQAGLTKQQLIIDAELRLRKAGIPVMTREEAFATPGAPFLYINV